jgi:hypothetical protein
MRSGAQSLHGMPQLKPRSPEIEPPLPSNLPVFQPMQSYNYQRMSSLQELTVNQTVIKHPRFLALLEISRPVFDAARGENQPFLREKSILEAP